MISDVLFEAIQEIESYQSDSATADIYSDPVKRALIEAVKANMRMLQSVLDSGEPAIQRAGAIGAAEDTTITNDKRKLEARATCVIIGALSNLVKKIEHDEPINYALLHAVSSRAAKIIKQLDVHVTEEVLVQV
jgi:hypothetical protein